MAHSRNSTLILDALVPYSSSGGISYGVPWQPINEPHDAFLRLRLDAEVFVPGTGDEQLNTGRIVA
jgi:hypothetical protein